MNADDRKWDTRYRQAAEPSAPARVLVENVHLLPQDGTALDLACGLGANALLLAERGLEVFAWDSSAVAIEKLQTRARACDLPVHTEVRDVVAHPPEHARFDVIVVSRFLDRRLTSHLMAALRPGGLLFYQTFTRIRVDASGPSNPDYLLADNELLSLFRPLQVLVYREEGRVGDLSHGFRGEAMLVARKVN